MRSALITPTTRSLGDREHRPVNVVGHAGDHALRRRTPLGWPFLPDEVEVPADSAAGHDGGLGEKLNSPTRCASRAPRGTSVGSGTVEYACPRVVALQRGDLVSRPDPHSVRVHAAGEGLDQPRTGAPDDVETRNGVAVTRSWVTASSFGPLHNREPANPQVMEPAALLIRRKHAYLGPASRPVVLQTVEGGAAQPIGQALALPCHGSGAVAAQANSP